MSSHRKLSSSLLTGLVLLESRLGEGVELRKTHLGEWLLVNRKFPFNDEDLSTRDAYLGVRCMDWSVGEIEKDLFDTSPNARVLLEFEPEASRVELIVEIGHLVSEWLMHDTALSHEVRARLGYDDAEYREVEICEASRRKNEVQHRLTEVRSGLIRNRADSWSELSSLLEEYEVQYLVHFTLFENLVGILKHGLLPNAVRKSLKLETPWNRSDWLRLDGLPEANCLSITVPNFPMFNRKRLDGGDWVVLGFDVLKILKLPSVFVPTNAARGGAFRLELASLSQMATPFAFKRMFSAANMTTGSRKMPRRYLNLTADPQAEVLVFDVIEPTCISFIALSGNRFEDQLHALKSHLPQAIEILEPSSELHRMMFDESRTGNA